MIKRETVTSLLAGFLVGACGIVPVVAGDGFSFGPAQGAASGGGGGSGDIEGVTAGNGLTGGGTSGSVTLNVAVSAGLTANADEITLDEELQDVAGTSPTDNGVLIGNGSAFVVESGATLKTSLGLTIGTDVQAYAADLANLVATAAVDASGNVTLASDANLTLAGTGVLRWADVGLSQYNSTTLRATIDGGTTDFNLWVSQLRATAGSESSVAVAFDLDANTGYYGNADTDLWSSIGGTKTSKLTTSIFDIGPKVLAFGTAVETNTATIRAGADTPEGAISANVGSIFLRTNGGAATSAYVKESGSGNTGWTAIGGGSGSALFAAFLDPRDGISPPGTSSLSVAAYSVRNGHPCMEFPASEEDSTQDDSVDFIFRVPSTFSTSNNLQVDWVWSAEGATSGNVVWIVEVEAFGPALIDLDSDSFDTAQTVTTATSGTDGNTVTSSIQFTVAEFDGVAAGNLVRIRLTRNSNEALDTLAVRAQVYGMSVEEEAP